jgi:hypothetical protein
MKKAPAAKAKAPAKPDDSGSNGAGPSDSGMSETLGGSRGGSGRPGFGSKSAARAAKDSDGAANFPFGPSPEPQSPGSPDVPDRSPIPLPYAERIGMPGQDMRVIRRESKDSE